MKFKDLFIATLFIGYIFGIILASIFGFTYWIQPFLRTGNPMSLFFAIWYAIFMPILGHIFFGIPWILSNIFNAFLISIYFLKRGLPNFWESTVISLFSTFLTTMCAYMLYLKPLSISQNNCDAICLGLEKEWMPGVRLMNFIIISLALSGLVQNCFVFLKFNDKLKT